MIFSKCRHVATLAAAVAAFLLLPAAAVAHEPSKSYLGITLDSNQLSGQWDIPLKDLQSVVPLELDSEGIVTWEKLHTNYPAVIAFATAHLKLNVDGEPAMLRVTNTEPTVEEFADGSYLEVPFFLQKGSLATYFTAPKILEIEYSLFFDRNSLHRGLLRFSRPISENNHLNWGRQNPRGSSSSFCRKVFSTSGPATITFCFYSRCSCPPCCGATPENGSRFPLCVRRS